MADSDGKLPARLDPREMMKQLTVGQMVSLGIIVLASIALIISVFFYVTREEMVPLFSQQLDAKTLKQIQTELTTRQVPFEITSKGRIMVPKSRQLELQTDFEAMDILPTDKTGLSVLDETNPLKSGEFMMKLRALEAKALDIEKSLEENPDVLKAEVKIVPAKDSPFADETTPAKASVMLRLKSQAQLTAAQVLAMQQSVASAIEGASPENVTITDHNYNLLSRAASDDTAVGVSNSNLEVKRRMEREYENKIHEIVETFLGPGKAKAKVSLDVSFDQVKTVEKRYGGPDAEGEPQRYNEQVKTEVINRDGGAGDAVGAAANTAQGGIPAEPTGEAGSNINRNTTTNQYFIDELQTSTERTPYDIRRISVALQLDYKTVEVETGKPGLLAKLTQSEPTWIETRHEALSEEEMNKVRDLVAAVISYSEKRGDTISIQNIEFLPLVSKTDKAAMETGLLLEYAKRWTMPILHLILFILFVMWAISLFRRFVAPILQQAQLEEPALSAALPSGPPKTVAELESELEQEIEATSPSAQLSKSEIMKKRLIEMVQHDPESVAGLVRTWLLEDD